MKTARTLTDLRKNLNGKVYVYLASSKIAEQFLRDAENEGFLFGKIKPTESKPSDIIALDSNQQLSHVVTVGHIAFQCNGGDSNSGFYRVDYEKFIKGEREFYLTKV